MKKKIVLILLATLVLFLPFQQNYLEVDAAIASKAAGLTAKKVAKEVIQDSAINQAIKIAADQSKRLQDPSRMVKEGHMMFCMDYTYKPGDKCNKPASIKANLTDADKANIKTQAGTEIDKLVSPNGKGFTKWQKFLDWFVPIWLITFAVTAITYALDPDVKSLFDEAAYNTLVSLGLIAPVLDSTEIEPMSDAAIKEPAYADPEQQQFIPSLSKVRGGYNALIMIDPINIPAENLLFEVQRFSTDDSEMGSFISTDIGINWVTQWQVGTSAMYVYANAYPGVNEVTIALNGETISSRETVNQSVPLNSSTAGLTIATQKIKSIQSRLPYKIGDFYYTDVLMFTVSGNTLEFQIKSTEINIPSNITSLDSNNRAQMSNMNSYFIAHQDVPPNRKILPPPFEESGISPTDETTYKDDKGNIAILPPAAFTYVEESTGEQVERKQAPNGDGYVWQKPNGTEVPEENVIPKPNEEPKVTPSPSGTPQYTPAPTPSNPAPEPVPLQPDPNAPPANPPPTTDPPPGVPPDAPACDSKLQFPIFSPLKETFSTSFPFSIPWDIERAVHAAFGEIGNKKPEFTLNLKFMGENNEVKITMPAFFDSWKPFTDSFLLFTFDILIMFGIYRFVKGAGS